MKSQTIDLDVKLADKMQIKNVEVGKALADEAKYTTEQ